MMLIELLRSQCPIRIILAFLPHPIVNVQSPRTQLLVAALPPLAASFVVFTSAEAGRNVGYMQLAFAAASVAVVLMFRLFDPVMKAKAAPVVAVLTLLGLAVPLLLDRAAPSRWIPVGALQLYAAPLLLPALVVVCAKWSHANGLAQSSIALATASALLALQPDASQVLALLAAGTVIMVRVRRNTILRYVCWLFIASMAAWALTQPDPLQPVPYVEGVFSTAFRHSSLSGALVVLGAFGFLSGLWLCALRWSKDLFALIAYYAVLFVMSALALTPAPILGFGAGPLLGYALAVAVLVWISASIVKDDA